MWRFCHISKSGSRSITGALEATNWWKFGISATPVQGGLLLETSAIKLFPMIMALPVTIRAFSHGIIVSL